MAMGVKLRETQVNSIAFHLMERVSDELEREGVEANDDLLDQLEDVVGDPVRDILRSLEV
jgi:hypothetical protein